MIFTCECGHEKERHILTNYVTTQDACGVCGYDCIHFKEVTNLEYLEQLYDKRLVQ